MSGFFFRFNNHKKNIAPRPKGNREVMRNYHNIKKSTSEIKSKLKEISKIILNPPNNQTIIFIQQTIAKLEAELSNLETEHEITNNKIMELSNQIVPSMQKEIDNHDMRINKHENDIQTLYSLAKTN